jgi:hypothetical protein
MRRRPARPLPSGSDELARMPRWILGFFQHRVAGQARPADLRQGVHQHAELAARQPGAVVVARPVLEALAQVVRACPACAAASTRVSTRNCSSQLEHQALDAVGGAGCGAGRRCAQAQGHAIGQRAAIGEVVGAVSMRRCGACIGSGRSAAVQAAAAEVQRGVAGQARRVAALSSSAVAATAARRCAAERGIASGGRRPGLAAHPGFDSASSTSKQRW